MSRALLPDLSARPWTFVEGAPVRGDVSQKRIALIFTGGDFGEGSQHILDTLEECRWRINGAGNAAERLGLHPNTLRFRMKKLGIARPGGVPASAASVRC